MAAKQEKSREFKEVERGDGFILYKTSIVYSNLSRRSSCSSRLYGSDMVVSMEDLGAFLAMARHRAREAVKDKQEGQKRDAAHEEGDRILSDLEKRVTKTYSEAARTAEARLREYLKKFEKQDEERRGLVAEGKLTQEEYEKWRRDKVINERRWRQVSKMLGQDLTDAAKISMSIVNGQLPEVYAENYNWGTYEVEHGTTIETVFTLYDRSTVATLLRDQPDLYPQAGVNEGKDVRWNSQHVTSAVTQGLLLGEPMDKVAKRISRVAEMSSGTAIRAARTCITAAENLGRVDSYRRAQNFGIKVQKQWLATPDRRTRSSPRALDGGAGGVGGRFSNRPRVPGDSSGAGSEVYNCRCTLVADLEDFPAEQVNRASKLGDMTYAEWKQEHRDRTIPASTEGVEAPSPRVTVPDVVADTESVFNTEEFANRFPSANYEEEDKSGAFRRTITDFNSIEAKHLTDSEAKAIYERQKESISGIDELEKKAYSKKGYFGGNSYDAINGGLRRGDLDISRHGDVVDALDRMVAGSVLDEDTALIRYAGVDEIANAMGISEMDFYSTPIEEVRSALVGKELVDRAYTSTAYKGTIRTLAEQPVRMNFIARKGTNAYVRRDGEESEVLLGREIKKHVVGVRQIRYFDGDLMDVFDDEDMAWGIMYIIDVVV